MVKLPLTHWLAHTPFKLYVIVDIVAAVIREYVMDTNKLNDDDDDDDDGTNKKEKEKKVKKQIYRIRSRVGLRTARIQCEKKILFHNANAYERSLLISSIFFTRTHTLCPNIYIHNEHVKCECLR